MQRTKALTKARSKEWFWEIFKYAMVFGIFYLGGIAKINSLLPFWFGIYVALLLRKKNIFVLSALFLLGMFLSDFNVYDIVVASNMIVVFAIATSLHNHYNKKITLSLAGIYTLLGSVCYVYFNSINATSLVSSGVSVLLGLIYMFACIVTTEALASRNFVFKLNVDELVCLGVMIAGVFCGLSYLAVFGIELSKIIAVITVLILSSIAPTFAIGAGLVFGLGVAFGNGSVAYIACFAFMGMLASVFRTTNRIYSTLSVIIVEILFGMYFEVFGEYNVFYAISTLIGCLIYIFLPSAWLARLSSCFNLSESSTVKNVYNQNNMLVSRKLLEVSEVFYEMDKVYRQFVKGVLPIEEAKKMLSAELISGCCADCKEHKYCLRANGEQMRECIDEIFNIGFEKGKITLLDIPPFLSTKCTRTNQFVSLVNSLIYQYSQYTKMVGNLDNSKILIADQLCGVSKIMNKISHELDRTITFDKALEDKIIEELVYKNIICKEVAVYEQSNEVTVVSIVIRNSDANKPIIMQTVENVCHQKMVIDDVSPSTSSGLSTIVYKTAPKYNILLGLARANKNNCELSGDSHTLTKITDTKYMLGICDGMGSGEEAERISNLTISLVEDFYKADFDSEIILSSVNKLLALQSVDRFATLDICVLDLSSAVADFIKLGSCEGLIKHSDTVTTIPSGALPIGMLDKVSPKITKSVVDKGDMIVLYSDGIQDAFGEIQSLSDFVNNINTLNPQFLAEQVLARAIELNSGLPKDDMTILVAKVF